MKELDNKFDSVANGELLLFRTLWNNSSDNMFIVSLDDYGNFINESCNRSQEKTFNLTPGQVDGVKLKDILDEEIYRSLADKYNQCISLNKAVTYEESVIVDDTGERYFTTTILPVKDDEGIRIFGVSREITELRRLEEERVKKEKEKIIIEQTKNAQMSEIIANIAHQWRQPLTVISTSISGVLIHKEMGISKERQEVESLNDIMENVQYLSDTIDTFRDYIKEKREYTEVILQDRLHTAINIVRGSLKNNNINLINNIDNIGPIRTTLVLGELSEVVINIINNAKDALLSNKTKTPFIKVNLAKKDNKAVVTIEDNGGGIDEDILSKIFDPYFTTKHQSQGTGLGLYMSKNIIKSHLNGNITVSNTQTGAVFSIELPLRGI
ncbi:MAG: PAS domain-containing sensor histidine kinase [Campylobacterota bacterium]|nr:PAS domain-containing sensor histidine kinase [Campylobacterota bacterium]